MAPLTSAAPSSRRRMAVHRRRRWANRALWSACGLGMLLVVAPLVWILAGVVYDAASHWQWNVLTSETTGVGGGLSNTIVGTLVLIVGVATLAGAVGIGTGIFIAELCPRRPAAVLRSASEVLAGVPSIVFGYVGYVSLVVYFHWSFSLGAALIVLSLLVVPYVAKATELALSQVPVSYREGSDALGMTRTHSLRRIVLRSALPGISTGIIIALAISVGETAPLLYTAGFTNTMPSLHPTHSPVPYLTYAVWTFFDEPTGNSVQLAHDAALLLVVVVLGLILLSRLIVRLTQRHAPGQQTGSGRRQKRNVLEAALAGATATSSAASASPNEPPAPGDPAT